MHKVLYISVSRCSAPQLPLIPYVPPHAVEPTEYVRNRCSVSLGCFSVYPGRSVQVSEYSLREGCTVTLATAGQSMETTMQHIAWKSEASCCYSRRQTMVTVGATPSVLANIVEEENDTANTDFKQIGSVFDLPFVF
jgi:hypothetical protein